MARDQGSDHRGSSEPCGGPRLIFIGGVMPRSGTNFLADLLLAHPGVVRPTGHWELPLLEVGPEFDRFCQSFVARRGRHRLPHTIDELASGFGRGFLELLVPRPPTFAS